MSIQQTLHKARQHLQSGNYESAIKLYRGLLRLAPRHPQINGLLGMLLLQTGRPEQAIRPSELAYAGEQSNAENWIRLMAVYHRSGRVTQARALLAKGVEIAVPQDLIERIRFSLNEPPPEALAAIGGLMKNGNCVGAEIAARMMVADYPDSQVAKECLGHVVEICAVA